MYPNKDRKQGRQMRPSERRSGTFRSRERLPPLGPFGYRGIGAPLSPTQGVRIGSPHPPPYGSLALRNSSAARARLAGAFLLMAAACSDSPATPNETGAGGTSQMVGPAGGTVSHAGTVTLTIPPGALSSEQQITIREVSAASLGSEWDDLDGTVAKVFELSPSGLTFAQPIAVQVDVADPDGGSETEFTGAILSTLTDGEIEILGGGGATRVGANIRISTNLAHFSPLVASLESWRAELLDVPLSVYVGDVFRPTVSVTTNTGSGAAEFGSFDWRDASSAPVAIIGSADVPLAGAFDIVGMLTYTCNAESTGRIQGSVHVRRIRSLNEMAIGPIGTNIACLPLPMHTLTITRSGTGTGTVTSAPAGVDCGTDCTGTYVHQTVVTLTATPAAGSSFCGWTATDFGSTEEEPVITVTMTLSATADACFDDVAPNELITSFGNFNFTTPGPIPPGQYDIPLLDELGAPAGSIPLGFSGMTFVGLNPNRWGFGQDGAMMIGLGDATLPPGFPGVDGQDVNVCGVGNATPVSCRCAGATRKAAS